MATSREQNAGRSHNIKIDNSFERVEQIKYLGIILKNRNLFQDEIKIRLKSENACWHSVHNLLFSSLLSKNMQIEIHKTIIWSLFCMDVKTGSSH
jgi:hypothetical protein